MVHNFGSGICIPCGLEIGRNGLKKHSVVSGGEAAHKIQRNAKTTHSALLINI